MGKDKMLKVTLGLVDTQGTQLGHGWQIQRAYHRQARPHKKALEGEVQQTVAMLEHIGTTTSAPPPS